MSDLEKLIKDRAYWADRKSRLRKIMTKAYWSCKKAKKETYQFDNCYAKAMDLMKEITSEGDFLPYHECFAEIDPCNSCLRHRDLKEARSYAAARLGQIHAAMTRIGRRLLKESENG